MASKKDVAEAEVVTVANVSPPLVEAKLSAPSDRSDVVDRLHVQRALDAGADTVLTILAAPAGYGKTTAIRVWCAAQDAALMWVTLDAGDNDPSRLWRYIATAVDRVRTGLARPVLERLDVTGGSIELVVDELMSVLSRRKKPAILVLDDLHTVTDPDTLASIDYALSQVPAHVRVMVGTRVDPPLALARMRVAQQLIEIRASDLAFSADEARALLVDQNGLDLSTAQVDVLLDRTQGWPAALVLVGIWLRGVADPSDAVSSFSGSQRVVADYLSTEVLAALDQDHRSFLHGVAVLGQCTPALCDAALDRTDSAEMLAELEHADLFVSRLERSDWHRIHPLFAEYAQVELEATEPGAAARIHRRAASWLAQDRPIEAMAHASAAGEQEVVAELLAEHHLALVRSGASRTILHWASALPDDVLIKHPEIACAAAVATVLLAKGMMQLRRYLRIIDEARAAQPERNVYVESIGLIVRALAIESGVDRALQEGRRAVELTVASAETLAMGALTAYARALYLAGIPDEARESAIATLEQPEIHDSPPSFIHAHTTLALIAADEDRLSSAQGHVEQAKKAVGSIGSERSWLGANVAAASGVVRTAGGDLSAAEHDLATAERVFRDEVPTVHHIWVLALLARVRSRRGRLDSATEALVLARNELVEQPDAGALPALIEEVQIELAAMSERAASGDLVDTPTEAELTVLRLLADDLSVHEISERLFVSENTVRSHRRALYRKLGVHSRDEAVARATAVELLDPPQSPG